jgi:uncharacterized membrane protein
MTDMGERTTPTPDGGKDKQSGGGFDFNQPTIISLLYLAGYVTGVSAIVGVVLGYLWRSEPKAEWEVSHYAYLIRTFWIGLIGSIVGIVLTVVLIGILILIAVGVLVIIRSVLSLIAAQKHEPMPNPDSWLI